MKAELLSVFGDDLMVANVARVSMGKWHETFEDGDARLIAYLAKSGHWSPFSHPKIQIRLTLPIFVARQWEKHRVGALRGYDIYDQNEQSRRYVDDPPEFFSVDAWRARPDGNIKQGSGEELPTEKQSVADEIYSEALHTCATAYQELLRLGVAPELARMVLPQSMYTTWVETGSLYYFSNLYALRTDHHAQKEIQDLAEQIGEIVADAFPISWNELIARTV